MTPTEDSGQSGHAPPSPEEIAANRARLIANGAEFGTDADMRPDEPAPPSPEANADRDALARMVQRYRDQPNGMGSVFEVANAIIAAGFRLPPQAAAPATPEDPPIGVPCHACGGSGSFQTGQPTPGYDGEVETEPCGYCDGTGRQGTQPPLSDDGPKLPCEVRLPPGTTFGPGVSIAMLLRAIHDPKRPTHFVPPPPPEGMIATLTEAQTALMMCGRIFMQAEPFRRFHRDAIDAALHNIGLILAASTSAGGSRGGERHSYPLSDLLPPRSQRPRLGNR